VSSQANAVHVMDHHGDKMFGDEFPNSRIGSTKMVASILAKNDCKDKHLCFGLEATGHYGDHLAIFLRETPMLKNISRAVYLLNPKQIKKFRDSYSDIPKTDFTDAFVIADSLRFGRIGMKGSIVEDKYLALQSLTRWRFQTAKDLTREKNRYLQNLFLKFSTFAQLQASSESLFSDTFGNTALQLMEEFDSVDEIAYCPLEELVDFLVEHSKNHFKDPEGLAEELKKAARSSYRLSKAVNNSLNQVMAMQINTIRFLQQQLKETDKYIEKQMTAIPCTLTSVPGIGPVYAAGLIAEIGDVKRFKNEAALAKYAGLTWTKHQSGKFEAENSRLIQGGNKFLRYYFCQAANKVRLHDPDYRSFYQSKLRECKTSPHKRALVLTARKLVRLVYALLRDQRLYKIQTK